MSAEPSAAEPAGLDFWFEFASTYSYLAASRISALAKERSLAVRWRPFLLGPIFAEQGWNDSPFNLYPVKGRYMWRDMERLCARSGLPFARPSIFPQNGLLAARVACAAAREPWQPEFVRGVYRANFADGCDISQRQTIARVLEASGASPEWLERAATTENKKRLRDQTDEAKRLGLFGAPSFTIAAELFWGNDRLEEALDHASGAAAERRAATARSPRP